MRKKRFDLLSTGSPFMTHEQVLQWLALPRPMLNRLVATGQLTQFRCAIGPGPNGMRVFYIRAQVERVKAQRRTRARRARV